jgi:hypothetical protein
MSWRRIVRASQWAGSWRRSGGQRPGWSEALGPWLLMAGVAHAALILAVRTSSESERAASVEAATVPLPDRPWAAISFELMSEPDGRGGAAAPPRALDHATDIERAPRAASLPTSTSQRAIAARDERGQRNAVELNPATLRAASSERDGSAGGGELDAQGGTPGVEHDGAAPRLSLRDLGVGGSNPFIGSPSELPTQRQLQNHRLRQSLRGELARSDQRLGLGPEGPAVAAVKEIVLASATAPNTSALLGVRTDGAGAVIGVEVLEADRDGDEWGRIAERLRQALSGKRLRVPSRSRGVSFQLRVVSRVQLPSGADPGLAIDLFGMPVKHGEGDKSTKISLISPMLREVTLPGSDGATILVPTIDIFGVAGDLADIGAVARRLVTAYLVAMDTDIPLEGADPAAR